MSNEMIERVARAIEVALHQRPYGLYDYRAYPGDAPPHQVRDEKDGKLVFLSCDADKAHDVWSKLTKEYVARAAIAAMREPIGAMLEATSPVCSNDWQYALET